MRYRLKRESTAAGVGFFSAVPGGITNPGQAIAYIQKHPDDEFMRRFLLKMLGHVGPEEFYGLCERAVREDPPEFQSLLYEACLMHPDYAQFRSLFENLDLAALARLSPLPLIAASLLPGRDDHRCWLRLVEDNVTAHEPIPRAIAADLSKVVDEEALTRALAPAATVAQVFAERYGAGLPEAASLPSAEEVHRMALERLTRLDVYADVEQRHTASLSPVALMRRWNMDVHVQNGRLDYHMEGVQISYGKGLSLDVARASLNMEIAERVSSYASFGADGVLGRTRPYPLEIGGREELAAEGLETLDLNALSPDAPYVGQMLYWMQGQAPDGRVVYVPPQLVFLFCNLDEPTLYASLDSTGLASGVTMSQARAAALCEVLERDAESLGLYDPARCFRLTTRDPALAKLLADHEAQGAHVVFQDISTEFGVPCYKAFVVLEDGSVTRGTACSLNGQKAALSALLETMHPYPGGPATRAWPEGLPEIAWEDLPNYATGHPDHDLTLLEETLARNGYEPIYVDLTRADLEIPVAKCFVPGLELAPDFSSARRVSPRLMARIKGLVGI